MRRRRWTRRRYLLRVRTARRWRSFFEEPDVFAEDDEDSEHNTISIGTDDKAK